MPIVVKVLPKAEYQAWLAAQKATAAPQAPEPEPAPAVPAASEPAQAADVAQAPAAAPAA